MAKNDISDIQAELESIASTLFIIAGEFLEGNVTFSDGIIGESLNGVALHLGRITKDLDEINEAQLKAQRK